MSKRKKTFKFKKANIIPQYQAKNSAVEGTNTLTLDAGNDNCLGFPCTLVAANYSQIDKIRHGFHSSFPLVFLPLLHNYAHH